MPNVSDSKTAPRPIDRMPFSVASSQLLMAFLLLQTEIIYDMIPYSAIALDSLFPVRQSPVCRPTRFLFGSALQSSPTA